MKYVLDPLVFALNADFSEREFKRFVNRINLWGRWMDEHPKDIYVLSDTDYLLSDPMRFPVYPVFDELMKKYSIDYVRSSDLNQTIANLIGKTAKIDRYDSKAVDCDFSLDRIRLPESLNLSERSDKMKDVFRRLLWSIFCQCKVNGESPDTYILFCDNINSNIEFTVAYRTLEETENGEIQEVAYEETLTVKCRSSLAEFFKNESTPQDVLSSAECKDDLALAIQVSVYQNGGLKKVMDSVYGYNFHIQDSFYSDFCSAHYSSQPSFLNSLVEAMSHTVLNMHMSKREDFRTGKGGNNPQTRHGDYLAWRRYVTRSVKMQYWQKDERYKFANVKEHDIFVCEWED